MSGLGEKRQSNATQLVQVGGHGGEQVGNSDHDWVLTFLILGNYFHIWIFKPLF